jgi:hypothetical protein
MPSAAVYDVDRVVAAHLGFRVFFVKMTPSFISEFGRGNSNSKTVSIILY